MPADAGSMPVVSDRWPPADWPVVTIRLTSLCRIVSGFLAETQMRQRQQIHPTVAKVVSSAVSSSRTDSGSNTALSRRYNNGRYRRTLRRGRGARSRWPHRACRGSDRFELFALVGGGEAVTFGGGR